jgi:uncharacterized membrane protein
MLVAPPEVLVAIAAPWAHLYSHSRAAATVVTFAHVAPLVVGGGAAITLDRATIRLRRATPDERLTHLADLAAAHRLVVPALALSVLSGIALLAADLETFWDSWLYWLKMALVVLLLVNGGVMTRLERALRGDATDHDFHWRRLHRVAIASVILWLAVTFVGIALRETA